MFSRYGRIVDIRLNRDRFTGRCKGFAFVAMSREEEVDEVRGRRGLGCCRAETPWQLSELCVCSSCSSNVCCASCSSNV
jgi:hypothetical protein